MQPSGVSLPFCVVYVALPFYASVMSLPDIFSQLVTYETFSNLADHNHQVEIDGIDNRHRISPGQIPRSRKYSNLVAETEQRFYIQVY